jgi:hypothetical protein
LALDSKSGATEAFQLSKVSVQIVAEGVLAIPASPKESIKRFVKTQESIRIDNKETKEFDSALCLVNTAMLSHEGRFSGKADSNSIKKVRVGGLTAKKKESLLAQIEDENDSDLVDGLCDFNVMMALDRSLSREDMSSLCKIVAKYSRGHKKGIEVENKLKLVIKNSILII